MNYMTETDFVNAWIATWGEDYVYDLIERGFVPTRVIGANGEEWVWVQSALERARV